MENVQLLDRQQRLSALVYSQSASVYSRKFSVPENVFSAEVFLARRLCARLSHAESMSVDFAEFPKPERTARDFFATAGEWAPLSHLLKTHIIAPTQKMCCNMHPLSLPIVWGLYRNTL
jgi:hypothetical protein